MPEWNSEEIILSIFNLTVGICKQLIWTFCLFVFLLNGVGQHAARSLPVDLFTAPYYGKEKENVSS